MVASSLHSADRIRSFGRVSVTRRVTGRSQRPQDQDARPDGQHSAPPEMLELLPLVLTAIATIAVAATSWLNWRTAEAVRRTNEADLAVALQPVLVAQSGDTESWGLWYQVSNTGGIAAHLDLTAYRRGLFERGSGLEMTVAPKTSETGRWQLPPDLSLLVPEGSLTVLESVDGKILATHGFYFEDGRPIATERRMGMPFGSANHPRRVDRLYARAGRYVKSSLSQNDRLRRKLMAQRSPATDRWWPLLPTHAHFVDEDPSVEYTTYPP